MSSGKTERLINLTMALMAAQRFITKSEIFRVVAGYSGNAESMERMFERDKDDLRNLGIAIEVGGLDPLFDDEPGYRIKQSDYALALENLSAAELSLLAVAAKTWQEATFTNAAQSALRKLRSLGIENDATKYIDAPIHISIKNEYFSEIWRATNSHQLIKFTYPNAKNNLEDRELEPYGIAAWRGFWYVVGNDVKKNAIRVFKIERIGDSCVAIGKTKAFVVPANFEITKHLIMLKDATPVPIILQVRKNCCKAIRLKGEMINSGVEWDEITFNESNRENLIAEILWYGADIKVIAPTELKNRVTSALKELVANG